MEERFAFADVSGLENWEQVQKLLRGVRNRRMAMIALQYYLLEHSLEQIGQRMGMTKERVRQLLREFERRAKAYAKGAGLN